MRGQYESMRGQLRAMGAANVRLILQHNNDQKVINSLQNKVQGFTKDHVALIIGNSELAADSKELASRNAELRSEMKMLRLVC